MLHSFTDFNLAIPANGLYFFLLFALLAAVSHGQSGRENGKTRLPMVNPRQRMWVFSLGALVMLFTVIVAGGAEYAAAKFTSLENIDLHKAEESQLTALEATTATLAAIAPFESIYPFATGMAQGQQANLTASQESYKQAIWLRPLHVEYQLQAARNLFAMNQADQAEALLFNTLYMNPYSWGAQLELANYFLVSGKQEDGLNIMRGGLEMRPDKARAVIKSLVLAGVSRTEYFDAMPQRSRSWVTLGDFFRELDDLEAANRAYRHGIEALQYEEQPNGEIVWRYYDLMEKQQRNAEALELFRVALKIFPQNPYFLARQGLLYEREGLRDRAREAYRAAILIDPGLEWARNRLKKIDGSGSDYR
jgi:tetratricopeptide (TPR) repeat protein